VALDLDVQKTSKMTKVVAASVSAAAEYNRQ